MYTYMGEIFKEVRQARHISLKNAAGEDFSYSMLSRFENGEADLSSSKLLTALDNIHMDLSEFSHLVKGYQPDAYSHLKVEIWQAQSKGDLEKLRSMYEAEHKAYQASSKQVDALVRVLTIKTNMLFLDETITITDQEVEVLSDFLFTVEMWGQYELRLFAEVAPLLPLDLYYRYTREAMVKTDHFKKLPNIRNYIQTILINGFFKALDEQALTKATYFKQQIEEFSFHNNEAYLKIIYLFALGCFTFLIADKEEGKKQMADAVNILRLLDYPESASYYESNMQQWLDRFA